MSEKQTLLTQFVHTGRENPFTGGVNPVIQRASSLVLTV